MYSMDLGEEKGRLLGITFVLKCIHIPFFYYYFFLIVLQDLISMNMFLMEIPSRKPNTKKVRILYVKTFKTVHVVLTNHESLKCFFLFHNLLTTLAN